MNQSETLKNLRGVIPPMITPLKDADTLDVEGLERLIEHILGGGVHGLFILGTTGEAPALSYRVRDELMRRAIAHVAGRVPVLVGITDSCVAESVAFARKAANAGADAVVAAPPFYFPAGQPELADFIKLLVPQLPLPVFLYNMPALTKVVFDVVTLDAAVDFPGVMGVKDSSGDMGYFQRITALREQRPDWKFFVGPEHLLAESVLLGGDGCVGGGANVVPDLLVQLFIAAETGDLSLARSLHERLLAFGEIYRVGRHGSAVIKGIKCALGIMNICDDAMAAPFERFHVDERAMVNQIISTIQPVIRNRASPGTARVPQ